MSHDIAQPAPADIGNGLLPTGVRDLYAQLSREDLPTHRNDQVAHGMPYITGETCRTVLNRVLGPHAWNFRILDKWLDTEADEVLCLGELAADIPAGQFTADGTPLTHRVVHQAFGSQKIKRLRSNGTPTDLGFDYKGAQTDALKKAAADLGIGLFLSRKEETAWDPEKVSGEVSSNSAPTSSRPSSSASSAAKGSTSTTRPSRPSSAPAPSSAERAEKALDAAHAQTAGTRWTDDGLHCEVCNSPLQQVDFKARKAGEKDSVWTPQDLARIGKTKHNAIACWDHYKMLKARKENRDNDLPPEDLWVKNRSQSASSAPPTTPASSVNGSPTKSSRPARPSSTTAQPADLTQDRQKRLAELQAGLKRLADAAPTESQAPADAEQIEWLEGVIYEAVGDDTAGFLDLLFGSRELLMADVDAIETWTTKTNDWQTRAEYIAGLLPATAA